MSVEDKLNKTIELLKKAKGDKGTPDEKRKARKERRGKDKLTEGEKKVNYSSDSMGTGKDGAKTHWRKPKSGETGSKPADDKHAKDIRSNWGDQAVRPGNKPSVATGAAGGNSIHMEHHRDGYNQATNTPGPRIKAMKKSEVIDMLEKDGQRQSALLLKNWDEWDVNAEKALKKTKGPRFDHGSTVEIRKATKGHGYEVHEHKGGGKSVQHDGVKLSELDSAMGSGGSKKRMRATEGKNHVTHATVVHKADGTGYTLLGHTAHTLALANGKKSS